MNIYKKKCGHCKIIKTINDFHKNKRQKDGYHFNCKECVSLYKKLRRKKIFTLDKNITHKICSQCSVDKDIENFGKDKTIKTGYTSECKQCRNYDPLKIFSPDINIKNKCCNTCKEIKSIENFTKNRKNKDGHSNKCKHCSIKHIKTLQQRFNHWKSNAKNRKISFDLSIKDLEKIPKICYYTGIPLTFEINKDNTISLDRLNNNKGYEKDNVVFCCGFINYMKNDLSYEKFISTCKKISNYSIVKLSSSDLPTNSIQ